MSRREVVTVFLRRGGRILLLRRSAQVGTYRGKWAGVSGYLEGEPLAQAWAELREETGLGPADLDSLRGGPPLDVDDAGARLAWRVHPFLAEVKDRAEIRLDWEHVEMRWAAPGELASLEAVPGLEEALRRVAP
jgi:8-oxo-dGTP pyrophosphatase MutT (NUDIX family)